MRKYEIKHLILENLFKISNLDNKLFLFIAWPKSKKKNLRTISMSKVSLQIYLTSKNQNLSAHVVRVTITKFQILKMTMTIMKRISKVQLISLYLRMKNRRKTGHQVLDKKKKRRNNRIGKMSLTFSF